MSLSSLDLFICWLPSVSSSPPPPPPPPPAPPPSFYTVCPHDSQYGDSIPRQLIVFCLRPRQLLPPLFILHLPQTQAALYDFSASSSGCLASPPTSLPDSTEPAVVSNQNNIFKNSVNITPYKQRGPSLLAIHVFRCTLYHGGDAFGARGEPNMAIPSKFDVFIRSH